MDSRSRTRGRPSRHSGLLVSSEAPRREGEQRGHTIEDMTKSLCQMCVGDGEGNLCRTQRL